MSMLRQNLCLLVLLLFTACAHGQEKYNGAADDVVLQGFHWDSHSGVLMPDVGTKQTWYTIIEANADAIKEAGFTWVWFPPPSDSFAPQGYMPRRWNVLTSEYGTEQQLRSAIAALAPVKAMADIVINHRVGVATGGPDFADPPFDDNALAVVNNDDSGHGQGAPDSGDETNFGRDLDHSNGSVQSGVKTYLDLLAAAGFSGWRYDVAKGFAGKYVVLYNDHSKPQFSIGEFWDGDRQPILDWIDSTGGSWVDGNFRKESFGKSAAFDFPTRFHLYDAIMHGNFGRLRAENLGRAVPAGVVGYWPVMSVTFVDNHDTEWRRDHEHMAHGSGVRHFPGDTVSMAYAYVLTHPGVPCVYWSHFFDWGSPTRDRIIALMRVRRDQGINASSQVQIEAARAGLYAAIIDGKVAVKIGPADWSPGSGWRQPAAVDGPNFAVWVRGE